MMYIKIWGLSRCNVPYQYLLSITAIVKVVQVVTQCVLLGHAKKKFVLKLELESLKVYFGEKGGNAEKGRKRWIWL